MDERKITDYQFISAIGQGGMGTVELYKYIKDGSNWAIKKCMIVNKKINPDSEIKIMMKLNHQYIIKIEGSFFDKDYLYIVMEYAQSGDLLKKIVDRNCNFPEELILKWFSQIVIGIEFAHSKKIIHRDLKPSNIFLDHNLNVKIGDFGCSKIIEGIDDELITSVGTSLFKAPEVSLYKPYDNKCDMWSLGMILYQLYTLDKLSNNSGSGIEGMINSIKRKDSNLIIELIKKLLKQDPLERLDINQVIKLLEGKKFKKITYENGDTYEGMTEFYMKNGYGRYSWKNGNKFEGKWENDKRVNGFGIFYSKNGTRYEGEWVEEKKHGIGIYYSNDKNVLESEFKDDNATGYSFYTFKNGTKYEGQIEKCFPNGYGIIYYDKQNHYEGEFKAGKENGYGIYYSNNDRFEGRIDEGKKGIGVYYENGEKYEGSVIYQIEN